MTRLAPPWPPGLPLALSAATAAPPRPPAPISMESVAASSLARNVSSARPPAPPPPPPVRTLPAAPRRPDPPPPAAADRDAGHLPRPGRLGPGARRGDDGDLLAQGAPVEGGRAGRALHAEHGEPGGAVRAHAQAEIVAADEADLGATGKARLQQQRQHVARRLLVEGVAQIARPPLARGQRSPERLVELGRERVLRVGRRAEPEPRQVLERGEGGSEGNPGTADEAVEFRLVGHEGEPARPRHPREPRPVLIAGDPPGPAGPGPGRIGRDDVAVALRRARGRGGQILVDHRELDQRVEERQGLVMGDVLLRLPARDQGQGQARGGVGHDVAPERITSARSPAPGRRDRARRRCRVAPPRHRSR